jgi:hypothetical protein
MTTSRAALMLCGLLAIGMVTGGCEPMPETRVGLDTLIAEHNTNASRVPRLWARAKIEVTLAGPDGGLPMTWGSVSPAASPNGLLLLSKSDDPAGPHDFVLIGREMAGMELFRLGTSHQEGVYYFWYRFGDESAAFWGRSELAGAPGTKSPAVSPNDLLAALGVTALPKDLTRPPAAALTMDIEPGRYAYVLNHLRAQPVTERMLLARQTRIRWSDVEPRQAQTVRYFDATGMAAMTAELAGYQRVAVDGDESAPGVMPTEINITWPASANRLRLVLSEMTTADKWDPSACRFRDHLPAGLPVADIIQLDAAIPTRKDR